MKSARGQFDSLRPLGRAGQGRLFVVRTRRPQPSAPGAQRSSGFTLVEMLVSTGLVVLIMLLFAQIFGSAIGTMTEQRGMANNDQKARTLSGVLRGDLQNMTYRQPAWPYGAVQGIVPLAAGDDPIIDPANQRGYFYFSENDPAIDWDDVLQFTTMIRSGQRGDAPTNNQQRPYVGKAASLSSAGNNQPVMDDGISGDGQGQSRAAEICYFLRNGNLYRRVLLLRDPLPASPTSDNQPTNSAGARVYTSTGTADYSGTNFYDDFDYAGTRNASALWFHSVNSLLNTMGMTNYPLGVPLLRYGFDYNATNGTAREFDSDGKFFGRFTSEETSDDSFKWPGKDDGTSSPYLKTIHDTTPDDGIIDQYASGDRVGEDILLTNVEAFDVEVFDQKVTTAGTPEFVDLTGAGSADWSLSNRFDTWHPNQGNSPPSRRVLDSTNISSNVWPASPLGVPALISGSASNNSFIYKTISGSGNGSKQPEFPPVPGTIVQDGNVRWQCVDNRVGLKAIRITVRYRDVSSNLSRQVTLVHSFVE